jgi:tetraacyldisaccharide 4'-kinase
MRGALAARAEALLQRHWWQARSTWLALLLAPLAALYGWLRRWVAGSPALAATLPVPVLVVGNVIAGGAGKTPAVIALVRALQAAGHQPGVISRGYGRSGDAVREVADGDSAAQVGDEPLLIRHRGGVPVWVGRQRAAAARALCQRHPSVDVIVSDDGLQHTALARSAELVVFDERGIGNGRLLPAGPLREPWAAPASPRRRVLYSAGQASTTVPCALATRTLGRAWPLLAWRSRDSSAAVALATLRERPLLAVAGLAAPEKFFGMLEAAGLAITRCPLPDHHPYDLLPWPAATKDVITTEKDAVKLARHALHGTRVWVVPLDLQLPADLVADLIALLFPAPAP